MDKVWMTNDIGGFIEVFPSYIYIKFSHSNRKTYRLDAMKLMHLLLNQRGEFGFGGLQFIPITTPEGEKQIAILNEGTTSDKDQAVVNKNELTEAIYYWFG